MTTPHPSAEPGRYAVGAEATLWIEKVVYGGFGLARLDGWTAFVPDTLEGEEVLARVERIQRNCLWMSAVRIVAPSPKRVIPPCPYIERCQGCQYQHMAYEEELRSKQLQVQEALAVLEGPPGSPLLIRSIRPSPQEWHYRNSVSLHSAASRTGIQRVCYKAEDGVTPIVVDACLLAEKPLQEVFGRQMKFTRPDERIHFKVNAFGQVHSGQSGRQIQMEAAGRKFLVSAEGFFQVNTRMAGEMARTVSRWIRPFGADLLIDGYAGVGLLGLSAAEEAAELIAIEDHPASFECLELNLKINGFSRAEAFKARTEKILPKLLEEIIPKTAAVILDPPRRGLEAGLAQTLSKAEGLAALVYLSCDLACLVRDLKILMSRNRWKIKEIQPFDMFPKTRHIETGALLIPS